MERIQSAIEKARVLRQSGGQSGGKPPEQRVRAAMSRQMPEPISEAWLAIEEFLPSVGTMEHNRILTFANGPEATPFHMMRTKVLQQMRANNWRRLAITSPSSACGKTMIGANLAFSLGRQADLRVALIELDMRRPALARTLGLKTGRQQFSRVLEGTVSAQDHMLRYGANLAFGINHTSIRNTSELLQSAAALDALNDLESRLDLSLTIFDMPPMLTSDDMLAFAEKVDCVLLVAAAESTTITQIDTCERNLAEQTNFLGVVLNKCRYADDANGYDYY